MRTKLAVAIVAAAVLLYVVLIAKRSWLLVTAGNPLAVTMGVALIVLPLVAAWAILRELWFGVRAERVGRRLEAEGGLPEESVAVHASGRVVREDGDAVFPRYRDDVKAHPEDWRAWYRLGLAYDAAGDRRRARGAIRQSLRWEARARRDAR